MAVKPNMSSFLFIELVMITIITTINISFCSGSCINSERQALLRFKQDLNDSFNMLETWTGDGDCCAWAGVVCNNSTGHVLQLQLGSNSFSGKINPSLIDLKHLIHLDLSFNNFEGVQIPGFIGSMENLRYLSLSSAGFVGMIPHQLGNLSNLEYLDIQTYYPTLYVENLNWISGLSQLNHLDLSGINLNKSYDWLLKINSLPFLEVLQLPRCQLQHFPHIPFANFSSLTTFDLSYNDFENSSIPNWLPTLTRLEYLSLHSNNLQGSIPSSLGNLISMQTLDLSGNMLEGSIPKSFERLCNLTSFTMSDGNFNLNISEVLDVFSKCVSAKLESLDLTYGNFSGHLTDQLGLFKNLETLTLGSNSIIGHLPSSLGELSSLITLDLSDNKLSGNIPSSLGELLSLRRLVLSNNNLNGPIPSSLGKLSALESLYLDYNKLNGTLSQVHFANLTRLTFFIASGNSLALKASSHWVPPFQLITLYLGSCHVGPQFPSWLRSQKSLSDLDISSAQISDVIPDWFWKSISQFTQLNLSNNQIRGEIPNLTGTREIVTLDLSSNNLSGSLPPMSIDVNSLDLSSNVLSGSISSFLCDGMNKSRTTEILNLKNNLLSGELPDCWMNWRNLAVMNFEDNEFTGRLPTSMGNLGVLQALILRKNSFSGVIPYESFKNCSNLEAIDAAENNFDGNVPRWIGERFPSMKILNFRSNKLHGRLPMELCRLSSLQILNLAYNNLSGNIPSCISNFSAMVTVNHSLDTDIAYLATAVDYYLDALLLRGGTEYEYETTLNLVRAIDLSKNNFSGEIPRELTSLVELRWLNLSHNSLSGRIPMNIGAMKEMESIDFSSNQLSGEIPPSISSLTFLSYLNLADNNLTGRIPTGGTQIQGFNASYFMGNDLCGSPLPDCIVTVETPEHENVGGKDGNYEQEVDWFYVSMALGFVVGFFGLIGPLLMNRRWMYMYSGFLDRLWDKIYFAARRRW
ncbi:hypothetical protein Ddye_027483 [Dipteronia dyeriana]|uniref:Leucine-rich repeat-containing N-terminal plant-type domain-containing protein n=1 Tax=Dipteronia dyeriana TaxID=168575 RepID=A0AAD9TPL8_9ROSI|nr:hypothetical protein Ddye_027483 [Dipteronia dyeriana]